MCFFFSLDHVIGSPRFVRGVHWWIKCFGFILFCPMRCVLLLIRTRIRIVKNMSIHCSISLNFKHIFIVRAKRQN